MKVANIVRSTPFTLLHTKAGLGPDVGFPAGESSEAFAAVPVAGGLEEEWRCLDSSGGGGGCGGLLAGRMG